MFQKQSMRLDAAVRGVEAILKAVMPTDPPIAVAVTDENGEPVYTARMDGAPPNEIRQAVRKAYTAAFIGRDTRQFRKQISEDGRTVADWSDPMVTTLYGGMTVKYQGQVAGGLGVSGATQDRDEELARIGLKAMGLDGASASGGRAERSSGMATAATKRQTFRLPGLSTSDAAPDLVKAGNLFFTSGIRGVDLKTGKLGATPEEQFTLAWRNLKALVEHAGLSSDNIGLVTNFIDKQDYRPNINPGWLELFPDEDNRPARKTTSYPLPEGEAVELQAFGVIGGRRERIEVKGLAHKDPLPNGVRMGDYVFSSVIVPQDLTTEKTVEGPERQTDVCFDNMRVFMEHAGGNVEDVVLQWVYLSDFKYQPYMVDVYLKAWPIGKYQAARKTFRYPMGAQIQIQVLGKLGGKRENFEIHNVEHHDPIPMGARIGDLYCSSGVPGVVPESSDHLQLVEGVVSQATHGLNNVKTLVQAGGGNMDDVAHLTLLVQDYNDLPAIDAAWKRMFPDPANRPARQVMKLGVQNRMKVQFHMIAAT